MFCSPVGLYIVNKFNIPVSIDIDFFNLSSILNLLNSSKLNSLISFIYSFSYVIQTFIP